MATSAQINSVRRQTGVDATVWPDTELSALIDGSTSINKAIATVWRSIAAANSTLVDVSESGSSRSMSQISKNALSMAAEFEKLDGTAGTDPDTGAVIARTRTRSAVRS